MHERDTMDADNLSLKKRRKQRQLSIAKNNIVVSKGYKNLKWYLNPTHPVLIAIVDG